jgi:phosphomannomutase
MFIYLFGMGIVGFLLGIFTAQKMLTVLSKAVSDLTAINHQVVQTFYNYRDEVKKFIDQAENEVKKMQDSFNKK